MPPRSSNAHSFSATNDPPKDFVECTLYTPENQICRKKCFGEKRYRSMQEHIRRAHPHHYIPKLPATEESVIQMMQSEAHEPLTAHDTSPPQPSAGWPDDLDGVADGWTDGLEGPHGHDTSSYSNTAMFQPNHFRRGSLMQATNAASALAQLHNSRPADTDWHGHQVGDEDVCWDYIYLPRQDAFGEPDDGYDDSYNYFAHEGSQDVFGDQGQSEMQNNMLHPGLDRPYSGRPSIAPFPRRPNRPRKSSVTENARRGKHERDRSKDMKRFSHDRKALSAEPNNERWRDLLDAAQSATEEESRDLTPIPQSPRSSMPPFQGQQDHYQSYKTSPLQNTLLPQESTEDSTASAYQTQPTEAFPSIESSYDAAAAGQHFPAHQHHTSGDSAHSHQPMYPPYAGPRAHASSTGSNFYVGPEGLSSPSQHSRPQTHDSNHNAFARPRSHTDNQPHFPHPLHAAHMAQQQAAAQQQNSNYGGPPPGAWSGHHPSFSNSGSGGSSGPSSANPNRPPAAHFQDMEREPVLHYCAMCRNTTSLTGSFACIECIHGFCRDCADVLSSDEAISRGQGCTKCGKVGSTFKMFNLDLKT